MKKLIISLVACMTVFCASVSCGKKQEETDNVSVSDSAVTETTSETKTKTESQTETQTTTKTTEKNTSETTTESEKSSSESEETSTESRTEKIKISVTENEDSEITSYEYVEDADPTAFIGKWECKRAVIDGEEITDIEGIPLYAVCQIELKDDDTVSVSENMTEYGVIEESPEYFWGMLSETEIGIMDENGDAMFFSFDGDYLVGTDMATDDVMYFVRVDEFTPFDFESFINGFNESDKTAFFGKWEGERAVVGGEETTDINDIPLSLIYQFDFKEDGTVLLGEVISEITEETIWSWSMLSKTEIAVIDGENDSMLMTLDGDYLIINDDTSDAMIYLVRVNEFTSVDDLNS